MEKNNTVEKKESGRKVLTRHQKRVLFYALVIAVPCIQFFFFYIFVNLNSIILAFQEYSTIQGQIGYQIKFNLFENFATAWGIFASSGSMLLNSIYLFLFNFAIVSTLGLIFSYYVAKKFPMSGLFRVMLFIPQIVSSVVLVVIYKEFVDKLFGTFFGHTIFGANDSPTGQYLAVLFYNVWAGFGVNVMLYTGAMSNIDQSIIESANLDGVTVFQEFIYIYVPLIFSTFTTFVVTGLASVFTSTMHLIPFFGTVLQPPFNVFGFFLYKQTLNGSEYVSGNNLSYSILSALGIIVTAILVPITLIVRRLMEKYGPSAD